MGFWKKFSQKFYTILITISSLLFLLPSCSKQLNINETFEKKYGKEIEKIKVERAQAKESKQQVTSSMAPTAEEVARDIVAESDYYPYVDVSKFGEKTPQNYLPNAESYEQTKANNPANSLPANMFEITYNTTLHPPFRKNDDAFDAIKIPPSDVYGVKTAMSEKAYLLAGNDVVQKTIDQINAEKTREDIEISHILIKEQKQLRRQEKMEKMFGKNSVELTSLEKKEQKKEQEVELKNAGNSSQNQSIGAAVSALIKSVVKN